MGQIIRKLTSGDKPQCGTPLPSGYQKESSYAVWAETTSARSTSPPTSGLARTTSPPTSSLARTTSAPTSGLVRTTSHPTSGLARTTSPPTNGLARTTSPPTSGLARTTSPPTSGLARTTSPPTISGLARTTSPPTSGLARTTSPPTSGLARTTSPPTSGLARTTSPPTSGLARTTSPPTSGLARTTSPPMRTSGLTRTTIQPSGLVRTTPSTFRTRVVLPSSKALVSSDSRVSIRPLFPRQEDFDNERDMSGVLPNLVRGPYSGCMEYRAIHARLLAEDFMLSLIEQVEEFRSSGTMTSRTYHVCIGEEILQWNRKKTAKMPSGKWTVEVLSDGDSNSGSIDEEQKKQKKLLFGSLVLLSQDNFKTFVFGVVRNSPPTLEVEGVRGVKDYGEFDRCSLKAFKGRDVLMIEAEAFYFPYFHVTEGLRRRADVPFMEEIVKTRTWKRTKPTYLGDPSVSDRIPRVRSAMSTQLNSSQLEAFDSVLRNRVALVQGPPGTGKTHLAVKIVQSLLALTDETPGAAPILVVTTTNHAVEEFLKRCLKFTQNVLHGRGVARDDVTSAADRPDYGELQRLYDACTNRFQQKGIMSRAQVIAMTSTRATYVRQDLDELKIKIVLVEEAAEALEAYIITSIPSSAQHLIMLGDHKQLRPITSHISLSTKYRLDVSLLERLVMNAFECPMLLEQRRMRPEIARLVKHIYPKLINHPTTEGRPDIAGVEKNLLFFTHNESEDQDLPNPSFYNVFEARMSAMLVKFLLESGHGAEDITVLATYKKQEQYIRQMMRRVGCSSVRVTCVDNFQGEENKIIVLSLTRSNHSGSIGFMKKENRACVALSRARDGLYILGSMRTLLASGAPVWREVEHELRAQGAQDSCFPLRCPHGRKFACSNAQHIDDAVQGCVMCAVERGLKSAEAEWKRANDEHEKALKLKVENCNGISKREKSLSRANQNLVKAMEKLKRYRLYQALFKLKMINVNHDTLDSVDLMIKKLSLSDIIYD